MTIAHTTHLPRPVAAASGMLRFMGVVEVMIGLLGVARAAAGVRPAAIALSALVIGIAHVWLGRGLYERRAGLRVATIAVLVAELVVCTLLAGIPQTGPVTIKADAAANAPNVVVILLLLRPSARAAFPAARRR